MGYRVDSAGIVATFVLRFCLQLNLLLSCKFLYSVHDIMYLPSTFMKIKLISYICCLRDFNTDYQIVKMWGL